MNNKLNNKFTFTDVAARRTRTKTTALIVISVAPDRKNKALDKVSISIHDRTIQKLNWISGSIINMSVDGDTCCLFPDVDGRALGLWGKKTNRGTLRYRIPSGLLPKM